MNMEALSELCTHLQERTEEDKAKLAHRLHDELGGLLTAAKMDLSWLQSRLTDRPEIQQRLAQLGNALDEAMSLKRSVVEELRPSLLDHFGLATTLRAHAESTCKAAGLRSSFKIDDDLGPIPKSTAITVFRIVQEALNNVIQHAQAKEVRIEFTDGHDKTYVLRLTDDGRGIDLNSPDFRWTHGLAGMRHRVQTLGGKFALDSKPGGGTALTVSVPQAPTTSNGHPPRSP